MCSSPQMGFSRAILRISSCKFLGKGGRPLLRDFQRQNMRNAWRCQRRKVSDWTITRESLESKNWDRTSKVSFVLRDALRGFYASLLIEGQLFSKEQTLGEEGRPGA